MTAIEIAEELEGWDYAGKRELKDAADELRRLAAIEQQYLAIMALEPCGWQSRFTFPNEKWAECAKEHFEWVVKNPRDWPDYEVRQLYVLPKVES